MAKAEQTPEYDGVVCVGGLVPSRAAERVEILQFNTRNFGVGLEVKGNIIRYIGNGSHSTDVGAIQTSKPVQSRGAVYYYEITILEMGERGCISLGFADSAFKLNRQCGWENNSYGYHGDDGKKYSGSGLGSNYASTFVTGDVVGAGLHTESNDVFFTKNGEWLGVAFHDVCTTPLFPTVGLHSKDERVSANFGSSGFAFDLEAYTAEESNKRTLAVSAQELSTSLTHELVRGYLNYHGYAKTLKALDSSAASGNIPTRERPESTVDANEVFPAAQSALAYDSSNLCQRAHIHSLILSGNMDKAEEDLRDKYPAVLESEYKAEVSVHLACQRYIEMIRTGNISSALKFARSCMSACVGLDASLDELIRAVTATVAYDHPEKSPLSKFLAVAHRERVADVVNSAILAVVHSTECESKRLLGKCDAGTTDVNPAPVSGEFKIPEVDAPEKAALFGLGSRTEVLLRQLLITALELRALNGRKGCRFNPS